MIYNGYNSDYSKLIGIVDSIKDKNLIREKLTNRVDDLIESKNILEDKIKKYKSNKIIMDSFSDADADKMKNAILEISKMIKNINLSSSLKSNYILSNYICYENNKKYINDETDEEGLYDEIT